jgi:LysM repeat protein
MQIKRNRILELMPGALLVLLAGVVLTLLTCMPGTAQAAWQSSPRVDKATCERTYYVRSGDTLAKIAGYFGVEPYQIVGTNNMKTPYTIYVGQKLCIPKPAVHAGQLKKLEKKYLNQGAAYFSVSWGPNGIVITPTNFPVKSNMRVLVDDMGDQGTHLQRLGVLNTKKGVSAYVFRLPQDLKDAKQLSVCLKNLKTDLRMCRNTPYR